MHPFNKFSSVSLLALLCVCASATALAVPNQKPALDAAGEQVVSAITANPQHHASLTTDTGAATGQVSVMATVEASDDQPIPAALWIPGAAMIGLAAVSRRRTLSAPNPA